MEKLSMNPNEIAQHNGCFLGMSSSMEESPLAVLCLPWDVTTSYRAGTSQGPEHVIEASYQVDLFSHWLKDAWMQKIATLPTDPRWHKMSQELRPKTEKYIEFLESGGELGSSSDMKEIVSEINHACVELHEWSQGQVSKLLKSGKRVLSLGGDHSVSLGPLKAYSQEYSDLNVLHFDAHADLRFEYEGFSHSHASIMNRVLKDTNIKKIVQVGIRDFCPEELEIISQGNRVQTYFDRDLKRAKFRGESWESQCRRIVESLGSRVYVSFDIDGLDPKLCPDTGTPVPGGLEFEEATYLIEKVVDSGRQIVGADLVEVAPSEAHEWNGNVGARLLWVMAQAILKSM